MHIGHNEDDIDHEDLAMRHFGVGLVKEQEGELAEALKEYQVACELDPGLTIARDRISALIAKSKNSSKRVKK